MHIRASLAPDLARMAATPAVDMAHLRHKALALERCAWPSRDYPTTIEGDEGLAWSLVQDVLRMTVPKP